MRLIVTAVLAATLLCPPTALALPGDPPVEALSPADGAVLPVSEDGIEVRYACPEPYRIAGESPFTTFGGRKDYGVHFASSPELGSDGRLLGSNLVASAGPDQVQDNDIPAGQCRAFMADSAGRPELTPGAYYWQAWRICLDCPGEYETSAVSSFRLTAGGSGPGAGVTLTVNPPARAYRGYSFAISVASDGIERGTEVALEVKRGNRWSTFGRLSVVGAGAEGPARLPRSLLAGRHQLRATARLGDETVSSAVKRLRLRKAKGWSTSGRQDGRWTGTSDGNLPTQFRVSGNGRTVRDGRFQITLLCPTPGMLNPFTIQLADAPLTKARIAPDGSFIFAGVVEGAASYVRGRIRGRTATGRTTLSLGPCTGGAEFKAKLG